MAITFPVSQVEPGKRLPVLDRETSLRSLLGAGQRTARRRFHWEPPAPPRTRVEALYASDAQLVVATDAHGLGEAALKAFYGHFPLVLTPDSIWFCLAQGFANHIALNAEALRDRFVRHAGKKKLEVMRADFFLGKRGISERSPQERPLTRHDQNSRSLPASGRSIQSRRIGAIGQPSRDRASGRLANGGRQCRRRGGDVAIGARPLPLRRVSSGDPSERQRR